MSKDDECCSDQCGSGLRNNYFEGKRITADSFKVEQKYLIDRRHLINQAVFGWGVIYGYEIKTGEAAWKDKARDLSIGPGFALDQHGRELVQTGNHLDLKDVLVLVDGRETRSLDSLDEKDAAGPWVLSVHYAERSLGLVKVSDPCECERDQWDHTCETVRFFLRRAEEKQDCCGDFDCELDCECTKGGCCQDPPRREGPAVSAQQETPGRDSGKTIEQANPHEVPRIPTKTQRRGGCRCLCDHLTHLQPLDDCHALCRIEEACGRVWVDLRHGVDLACVSLAKDCGKWTVGKFDACGPRRLVKRNDLLFDLIRGCDLTRISAIGWADWHRSEDPVEFDAFRRAFRTKEMEISSNRPRFTVTFSRPVKRDTVRPDCFAMTVMTTQREGGWLETFRVPIVDVLPTEPDKQGGDAEEITSVEMIVDQYWFDDAVKSHRSIFVKADTWIELEVRGSFIVDCNGQTVDADPRGLDKAPSGNGTPGGTFLSTFRVAPASDGPRLAEDNQ